MFQGGACEFCDDIFAETADVCLGDAWLPQYDSDWRGTNIVISRHADLDQLLREGARSGAVLLEDINLDLMALSQGGHFLHPWARLSFSPAAANAHAHGPDRLSPSVTTSVAAINL